MKGAILIKFIVIIITFLFRTVSGRHGYRKITHNNTYNKVFIMGSVVAWVFGGRTICQISLEIILELVILLRSHCTVGLTV